MPKATKLCRVCGKPYEACRSLKAAGPFNWKEVACSPECGEEYLRRVIEARTPKPPIPSPAETYSAEEPESDYEQEQDEGLFPDLFEDEEV